jgi:hypothetical protein
MSDPQWTVIRSGRAENRGAVKTIAVHLGQNLGAGDSYLARTIHEYRSVVRSSRPAGLFSFGLLDGLHVRLRLPYVREAPAGFGLERLAMAFMNHPG